MGKNLISKDKIRGMFLGCFIGDALGMPVESFSAERIAKEYGRITDYLVPLNHKWFDGEEAGTITDDAQLTGVVAESLIEAGKFDMDSQATWHIKAYKESVKGWGSTTREAVKRLSEGISWEKSGITDEPNRGTGNGVCMKVAPLAPYFITQKSSVDQVCKMVAELSFMTHKTSIAVSSGLIHTYGCANCLINSPESFVDRLFIAVTVGASRRGNAYKPTHTDDLTERMKLLYNYNQYTTERIVKDFRGSSYCYESVPFSYMFFLRNPFVIETLYEVISSGGDADTNGSMVGSLLGALNGSKIFPKHLIDGLKDIDKVNDLVDRFCAKFEIED